MAAERQMSQPAMPPAPPISSHMLVMSLTTFEVLKREKAAALRQPA